MCQMLWGVGHPSIVLIKPCSDQQLQHSPSLRVSSHHLSITNLLENSTLLSLTSFRQWPLLFTSCDNPVLKSLEFYNNNMKRVPQASYYDFSAVPRVTGPKQKYREELLYSYTDLKRHSISWVTPGLSEETHTPQSLLSQKPSSNPRNRTKREHCKPKALKQPTYQFIYAEVRVRYGIRGSDAEGCWWERAFLNPDWGICRDVERQTNRVWVWMPNRFLLGQANIKTVQIRAERDWCMDPDRVRGSLTLQL